LSTVAIQPGIQLARNTLLHRYKREISVLAAYLALLLFLGIRAPRFFTSNEFKSIIVNNASVLMVAVGMSLVILCRQIDISVGSQLSICGVVAGLSAKHGMPMPVVALSAICAGAVMGAVNGVLVAFVNLPSIVVTLATMVVLRESLRWIRSGEFVQGLPRNFQWFGMAQDAGQWVIVGIAGLVFGCFAWSMRNLAAGRTVYATGSDQEAARLAGIRPRLVTFSVFTLMGALCGLAALLNVVRFPSVDPKSGDGLEMLVIAAVVVGGIAISGGKGSLPGTLVGVALLGTIRPALPFLGSEAYWDKALQGLIILVAVASDALYERKKGSA
jgi:rhamnose transport system permease protein